jgi:hypothetical protein
MPEAGYIVIVDSLAHEHGRLMAEFAAQEGPCIRVEWLTPTLNLPRDLERLSGVDAVTVPLGVGGATRRDHFTRALCQAITKLGDRGIPVFVAAGSNHSNLLAGAGISVATEDVRGSTSTSEACVRAQAYNEAEEMMELGIDRGGTQLVAADDEVREVEHSMEIRATAQATNAAAVVGLHSAADAGLELERRHLLAAIPIIGLLLKLANAKDEYNHPE